MPRPSSKSRAREGPEPRRQEHQEENEAPVEPFQSNQEAWESGLRLLNTLQTLRNPYGNDPDERWAEHCIRAFVRRLRASGTSLALPRLHRALRLDQEGLIIVLASLAAYWGASSHSDMRSCVLTATGFDPGGMRRLASRVYDGRYEVRVTPEGRLRPSPNLLHLACESYDFNEEEADFIKGQISKLPSIEGRE